MRVTFCTTKTLSRDHTETNLYQRTPIDDVSSLFTMYTRSAKSEKALNFTNYLQSWLIICIREHILFNLTNTSLSSLLIPVIMNTLIEINRISQKSQQYQETKLIQHTFGVYYL